MFELLMLLSQIQISCLNKGSLIPYGHVSGRLVINDYPRIFCSETIKVTNMNNETIMQKDNRRQSASCIDRPNECIVIVSIMHVLVPWQCRYFI